MFKIDFRNNGCSIMLFIMLLNVTIGAVSVNYILSWMGKDIVWFGDVILGLFLGEIAVPIAVFGWLLKLFGLF